ncbi:YopX family protein [Fusicatenibacter saccharivorans]|uniref:YopX family protein n=1 Tax=Fusicatenibacter saccharivorans TaxID=1150298 RepID=UPI00321A7ED8
MQRKILFKAKSTDTGKWEEGLPNYCSTDGSVTKMVSYSPGSFKVFSIEPGTLCQYTGFMDVRGKKIFENDVVRILGNDNSLKKIIFAEKPIYDNICEDEVDKVYGWFYEGYPNNSVGALPLTVHDIEYWEMEVVGNSSDYKEEGATND